MQVTQVGNQSASSESGREKANRGELDRLIVCSQVRGRIIIALVTSEIIDLFSGAGRRRHFSPGYS